MGRVDDKAVAKTVANQATCGCVVSHFVCDRRHRTPAGAQAQLECIQDLYD